MVVRRIGSGPELVWIHGLGERSQCFDAITLHPALAGFTHVLPDLPGYGHSQPPVLPAEGDSLVQLADHLVSWLTTWPRRAAPVLLGHSLGGVLATLVAERMAVPGVVNIDGNLTRGDCTFSAEAASYPLAEFVAHGFAQMRAAVRARGETERALAGYARGLAVAQPEVFHRHSIDLVAASSADTLAPRLAALGVPVLFVAGVPGGICARSRSELERCGVRSVGVEPAGHWPFVDQPDAFAAAVGPFVRSLPGYGS